MVSARVLGFLLLSLLCCSSGPLRAASFVATVDERNGLPAVAIGGATAVSSDYVFWGKGWAWSGLSTDFKVLAPFGYAMAGKNQGLDFDLNVRIGKASDRQFAFSFDLDARSTTSDAIGGGM